MKPLPRGPRGRIAAGERELTPTRERLWLLVDQSGGPDACWPWKGARNRQGYGRFAITSRKQGAAHRVALELFLGEPLPADLMACHRCDNPPCCNPSHLFVGSALANKADCVAKRRHAKGETHYKSKLTAADAIFIREASGVTDTELADHFGVARSTIRAIRRRATWKHLHGPDKEGLR